MYKKGLIRKVKVNFKSLFQKLIWVVLMFYQTFLSPQVNWCTIITYKHGITEFFNALRNNLRLKNNKTHGIFTAGGAFVPTQEKKKRLKNKKNF